MSEVKTYRIEGLMLISHDKLPTWQKFVKEVRAVKPEDAIEYIYSVLGSNHKLRRKHIRIVKVEEISPSEARDRRIAYLSRLERFVKL